MNIFTVPQGYPAYPQQGYPQQVTYPGYPVQQQGFGYPGDTGYSEQQQAPYGAFQQQPGKSMEFGYTEDEE